MIWWVLLALSFGVALLVARSMREDGEYEQEIETEVQLFTNEFIHGFACWTYCQGADNGYISVAL